MYDDLGTVEEPVAISPREALDSAAALLAQQGYEVAQRTETSISVVRRKKEGFFGHSLRNLTVAVRTLPRGGVEIKLRGNDREGVQERRAEWSRWEEGLPKVGQDQQSHGQVAQAGLSSEPPGIGSEKARSDRREGTEAASVPSRIDEHERSTSSAPDEHETQTAPVGGYAEIHAASSEPGGWASVAPWSSEPPVAASKEGQPLTPRERASGSGDENEAKMESGMEKHAVRVGLKDGNVGETVSFTANLLGTARVNGGAEGGGMDYTFYRLPGGTFRVLVEYEDMAMLVPSDMDEAISRGQRNNYSYGRMTLEEMKAHPYNFGEVYEALMENHPETVRNRVRDID